MKIQQLLWIAVPTFSYTAVAVEPSGILLGDGMTLLPGVEVELESTDNLYHRPSGEETSSRVTRFRPNIALQIDAGDVLILGGYEAELGSYSADSNDNYLDHLLSVEAMLDVAAKQRIDLGLTYKKGHDGRGTGSTEGRDLTTIAEPSEFDETTIEGAYTYGARTSKMSASAYSEIYDLSYNNNEFETVPLEHGKTTLGTELSLRLGATLRSVFDLSTAKVSYSDTESKSRDSTTLKGLVGISWQVTGKTSGHAKVGMENRSFSNSGVDSVSNPAWDLKLQWFPRRYSEVTIQYGTSSEENYLFQGASVEEDSGTGSFISSDSLVFAWNHAYSVKWAHSLVFSRSNDVHEGSDSGREDTLNHYGLNLIYSPSRILDVTAGLTQLNRYSTLQGFDFDERLVSVGVNLAI
jgi:hypothetical protein